jgi:hypothetical protein
MPKVYNISDENRPNDCVYIGRGSYYGNPFIRGVDGTRGQVIEKYIDYVESNPELKHEIIQDLKGKNLVCFCKPKACHGDYLIQICNDVDGIEF